MIIAWSMNKRLISNWIHYQHKIYECIHTRRAFAVCTAFSIRYLLNPGFNLIYLHKSNWINKLHSDTQSVKKSKRTLLLFWDNKRISVFAIIFLLTDFEVTSIAHFRFSGGKRKNLEGKFSGRRKTYRKTGKININIT